MKPVFTVVVLLFCLGVSISVALAQRTVCSCVSSDTSCRGNVSCQGGCTAFCGTINSCYVGCRIDWIYERRSYKFSQKTGEEIIAIVAKKSKGRATKDIEFIPYKEQEGRRFDLDLKNDSLWRLFDYLSRYGTVKVRGTDFEKKIKPLRDYMTTGQLSIKLNRVTAEYAAAELSFLTGESLQVRQSDAKKRITISVENATLQDVLQHIREKTGVEIRRRKTTRSAVSRLTIKTVL
jgi:hypothetical protein